MSTYKVIQDVEAEDKILGPLTLRQFIYAGIAAICGYLSYFLATHGAGFMLVVFLPVCFIFAFFAIPWGRDQPTEVWALARIRFMLKPRRRIWSQSGVKELVTVTAPKRPQTMYTNNLSETEVKSRLHALADTLDSRGWAIKNSSVNLYSEPALIMGEPDSQERLINPSEMPQQVSPVDIHDSDDMMDELNNPTAQHMDNMIAASTKAHRQKIIENLNKPEPDPAMASKPAGPQGGGQQHPANNYWFLNQPGQSAHIPENMVTFNTQVVTPHMDEGEVPGGVSDAGTPAPNEKELVEELDARKRELPMTAYYGHLHTIQPLSAQQQQAQSDNAGQQSATHHEYPTPPPMPPAHAQPIGDNAGPSAQKQQNQPQADNTTPAQQTSTQGPAGQPQNQPNPAAPPVTPAQQAAILQLANNDDLNVATLAREAQRSEAADGEVVIKLH